MKINIALRILAVLLVCSCRKDSSSSGSPYIALISPANNSVAGITPTFKWNVSNTNGPYTLYLHYFSQSLNQYTTDTITTNSTSYTWSTVLMYNYSYSWYVRSNTYLSATDSFTTSNSPITLISPARNSVAGIMPTFKWSAGGLNGPYTLYLHYFSQYLSQYVTDSVSTTNTSYTWGASLLYDQGYSWYVRSGTVLSAIDSFTTIYPDSMFVGQYWVTVGAENYILSTGSDTSYGQCMATVSIVSPGVLNLHSDSFATLPVNLPYYSSGNGEYMYGNPYGPNASPTIFNVYADSITINSLYGYVHVSGESGTTWIGRKVH